MASIKGERWTKTGSVPTGRIATGGNIEEKDCGRCLVFALMMRVKTRQWPQLQSRDALFRKEIERELRLFHTGF